MTTRIFSFVAFVLRLFCALAIAAGTVTVGMAQQLPIDVDQLSQLTPEQRAQALQMLGQTPGLNSSQTENARSQDMPSRRTTEYHRRDETTSDACDDNAETAANGWRNDQAAADKVAPRERCLRTRRESHIETRSESEKALKPFGYDLFFSAPNSFAPMTNIPVPSDYVLGPGDNLRVQLYGTTNATFTLAVGRDGLINFPKLGPISVAGQRFDDARSLLQERLSKEMIGVQASITLGELRSIQVFLLGDVNQAGSYTISSLSTITNALIAGGGVSLVGSLRNVQLKRNGRTVRTLDLYDLLLRGDSSHDERLQPGDVIFIPPVGPHVSIAGEVKRPAIYELKGETRISDALALAGGVMASTNTSAVEIQRYDRNSKAILLQIDASKPTDLAIRMQDGDFIRVRKLDNRVDNHVRVLGYIRYPGSYEWSAGSDLGQILRTAQVLPSQTGKETYLPLGLIERTDADSGVRSWQSFSTRDILSGTASFPLQRDDLVVVLSRNDVEYLQSKAVREVAGGDFSSIRSCAGLKELAQAINSERSVRFVKALSSETARARMGEHSQNVDDMVNRRAAASSAAVENPVKESGHTGQAMSSANTSLPDIGHGGGQALSPSPDMSPSPDTSMIDTDEGQTGNTSPENPQCPAIFAYAPTALPYLLDQSVAVYGEVDRPGLYPIMPQTPLAQVISAAGGRSRESDPKNIEYVSYIDALKNGQPAYQQFELTQTQQLAISPGDIIDFRPLYSGQEIGTVLVSGEFRFPATYGILRGERLSQLMQRAGGLTDSAYADGAVFTRVSAVQAEQESYRRAAKDLQDAMVTAVSSGALGTNTTISTQFINSIIERLQNAPAIGRVVINANPAWLQKAPDLDPILEPGDSITMPKRPISVTVIGQVLNPGTLQYLPNVTPKQYIQRAGGYTQAADEKRTFIILPNGTARTMHVSFWHSSDDEIAPGSVIVVPRDASPFNLLGWSDRLFGILSQMAITAAALNTITK